MPQTPLEPMLCSVGKTEQLPILSDSEWIAEPKLDGERIIAERKSGIIYLWTRRAHNVAHKFPEVVNALKVEVMAQDWILDGELTVDGGFELLLQRNTEDKLRISILSKKMPATYHVFDVLRVGSLHLASRPLSERKEFLQRMVKDSDRLKKVIGVGGGEAQHMFDTLIQAGGEGIVIKRLDSPYEAGKRSANWLKVKRSDTVDVYVIGATASDSLPFGALVLMQDGMYFGKVGTGFSDAEREEILKVMSEHTDDIQSIHLPDGVREELLIRCNALPAEVRIQERMANGSPRHPVWVRWRMD